MDNTKKLFTNKRNFYQQTDRSKEIVLQNHTFITIGFGGPPSGRYFRYL